MSEKGKVIKRTDRVERSMTVKPPRDVGTTDDWQVKRLRGFKNARATSEDSAYKKLNKPLVYGSHTTHEPPKEWSRGPHTEDP